MQEIQVDLETRRTLGYFFKKETKTDRNKAGVDYATASGAGAAVGGVGASGRSGVGVSSTP